MQKKKAWQRIAGSLPNNPKKMETIGMWFTTSPFSSSSVLTSPLWILGFLAKSWALLILTGWKCPLQSSPEVIIEPWSKLTWFCRDTRDCPLRENCQNTGFSNPSICQIRLGAWFGNLTLVTKSFKLSTPGLKNDKETDCRQYNVFIFGNFGI